MGEVAGAAGVGFMVMVNVAGAPEQIVDPPIATGVTVIVAMTGVVPLLVAIKDGRFPVPDAASPIEGSLFVQVNELEFDPVNEVTVVVAPLQKVKFGG